MKISRYRIPLLLVALCLLVVFGIPSLKFHTHAQGPAGFTKIASPAGTTFLDTSCPKTGTCQYAVTATATGQPESGPSNTISVLNNGAAGNVSLSWTPGTCPAGKNCATPTGYNIYQNPPSVPPGGLAGVSQ